MSLLDGEKGRKQTLAQHFHDAVLEAGWLEKRGGGTRVLGSKGYKRRWFELVRTIKGIYLTYQGEPKDGMLKGAIKMSKARVQSDPNRRFSVHISHETKGTRSYHIKAPSLEEKFSWLRSINSLQVCTHMHDTHTHTRANPRPLEEEEVSLIVCLCCYAHSPAASYLLLPPHQQSIGLVGGLCAAPATSGLDTLSRSPPSTAIGVVARTSYRRAQDAQAKTTV